MAGMAFPLGIRLANANASGIAADVGRLPVTNTCEELLILSILVGFLILPRLGLENAVALTSVCSVVAGFLAWMKIRGRPPA